MPRLFAISDLHVDYKANMQHMLALSDQEFTDDSLIIAGDASDSLDKLELLLSRMAAKFHQVSFVPGNHELWLRKTDIPDSLEKFHRIEALCENLGVLTKPFVVGESANANKVWVVPLYSWYRIEDHDKHTLAIKKEGEDWDNSPWMDKMLCKWPERFGDDHSLVSDHFLQLNKAVLQREYDAPVVSFSHFLPRRELLFDNIEWVHRFCAVNGNGAETTGAVIPRFEQDPHPAFNFSRVAGCGKIDEQLRQLGSRVHIHGHQHRNRNRLIDGVTYVSNCLGYARERDILGANPEPLLIWDEGVFIEHDDSY